MYTLFACPRAFTNPEVERIQRMALESWLLLEPHPQIILFSDHPSTEKIAQEYGVETTPCLAFSPHGVPLLNFLFQKAEELARFETLVYVNADIMISSNFYSALHTVRKRWKKYLLISAPYVVDHTRFTIHPGYEKEATKYIVSSPLPFTADLFAYSKGVFTQMPPFRLGKGSWDSWLISYPLLKGIPVIDATSYVRLFHPNDRSSTHHPQSEFRSIMAKYQEDIKANILLAGYWVEASREVLPYFMDDTGTVHARYSGGLWLIQLKFVLKYFLHTHVVPGEGALKEKLNPFRRLKRIRKVAT